MKSLYLLIDFFSVIIPLLFSFHPKIQFHREWKYFLQSMLLTAIFFLVWDVVFTQLGVWGFNQNYVSGIFFFNLPIEEVLFFFCIPYSCVFSYFCLGKIFPQLLAARLNSFFIQAIAIVLLIISIFNFGKLYTALAFSLDGIFLLIAARMIPQKMFLFFISYLLMLIPFLIVNGILTGTGIENEVVWYSNNENLGIRLLTIPVEDFFYGMFLIGMNIILYELLNFSKKKNMVIH